MDKPPSAYGRYLITQADGKCWKLPLYSLMAPLSSWWVGPSAFDGAGQPYPKLPEGMTVLARSPDDLMELVTLMNGPAADGTYQVHSPAWDKIYHLSGKILAVSLETRLHLHQMDAMKQDIYSFKAQVGGQDASISDLRRKEMTTAAAFTKQKSECERAKELVSKMQTQVREKGAYISELKRKEMTTAAALMKKKSECERAEERISKIVQGERLMLSSAGEHDYGSNLPSPADLVQRIASIQDQLFVDWVAEALGDPCNTWLVAYEDIVKALLLTFLECEVQRSAPLKFSEKFGSREAWNPSEHHKDTFDPSYEGDKLVEGNTQVQVVIPRLFWEKKMADDDSISRYFETQASFVVPSA
ncbi:hypothetical protein Esi_0047_0010 [Ectocarpus siliculosus]|uniref:Uncharacterized protein n=1 Tax=Ectocarpus siliculosus TaxID=2880 RepID=D7G267_ECTSI|nr:hypothetical protein Esi_0047_0010 [Ectocarpus siliculosus]|eukprot:CBJ48744.1 hypothetical protein Esi_0047_0010 [Ectocarpus siliculosus]